VIGFLGRTGDAFTTTPHLHFEIHPQPLLRLGYDGAVDPTTYLRTWTTVKSATPLPRPALPRVPKGEPGIEAAVVWRQLLGTAEGRPALPAPAPRTRALFSHRDAGSGSVPSAPAGGLAAAALPHRPGRRSLPAFLWPLLAFAGAAAVVYGGFAGVSRLALRRDA
jgi:hypothetical protein